MFKLKKEPKKRRAELNDSKVSAVYRSGTALNIYRGDGTAELERQRLRRLRALQQRLAALLIVVVTIFVLGMALVMQYAGTVRSAVSNVKLTQTDKLNYAKLAEDYFRQNPFERFSLARRNGAMLEYLRKSAPEILDASIHTTGLLTSDIKLTFRAPVAQWVDHGGTSFVDDKGIVFKRNFYQAPALSIQDDSGATGTSGMATSANFLSFVGQTATILQKQYNIAVRRVVVPKGAARYVEFYLDSRAYPFKAQVTRQPASQAHDLSIITRYLDRNGIKPTYVDCRVVGKAFWK